MSERKPKLTPALLRALDAVRLGLVTQHYNSEGNTFFGPRGIAVRSFRRLEELRLIEDRPRTERTYATSFSQRLTAAGEAAMVTHSKNAIR